MSDIKEYHYRGFVLKFYCVRGGFFATYYGRIEGDRPWPQLTAATRRDIKNDFEDIINDYYNSEEYKDDIEEDLIEAGDHLINVQKKIIKDLELRVNHLERRIEKMKEGKV